MMRDRSEGNDGRRNSDRRLLQHRRRPDRLEKSPPHEKTTSAKITLLSLVLIDGGTDGRNTRIDRPPRRRDVDRRCKPLVYPVMDAVECRSQNPTRQEPREEYPNRKGMQA